jgi:hypothetical protein
MNQNPMDVAILCENKKQRETVLKIAKKTGIAFGNQVLKELDGNIVRIFTDGDWSFCYGAVSPKYVFRYTEFKNKYGK